MADPFGDFVIPAQLEEAAMATLIEWFPSYLRYIEKKLGMKPGEVPNPKTYRNRNKFTATKGEQLPRVVVISPGLIGQPTLHGRSYSAIYRLGVGVAHANTDETKANLFSKIYGTAAKLIIIHKRGLGTDGESQPFIRGITWIDENFDDLPIDHQTLLYKAAGEYFAVELDNVLNTVTGPDLPDQPDYPSYGVVPDIEHIFIDVEKMEEE